MVHNVHLSFGSRVVFDRLNLTLPSGCIVLIVGPSGVGKTTLVNLFMRLFAS